MIFDHQIAQFESAQKVFYEGCKKVCEACSKFNSKYKGCNIFYLDDEWVLCYNTENREIEEIFHSELLKFSDKELETFSELMTDAENIRKIYLKNL